MNRFIEFKYYFVCADGGELTFVIRLDGDSLLHVSPSAGEPPAWTRLEVDQCTDCPLDPAQHTHCPVALSLVELVERFNSLLSYSELHVSVETPERTISKETSAQKALSSLVGLYMATSGCPNMNFLKPMARFHLPFASREETIYRAAGTYLLAQYFRRKNNQPSDENLEGLYAAYDKLHTVNVGIAKRLRNVSSGDANVNAIVLLDLFAHDLPSAINVKLKDLEKHFAPYFQSEDEDRL